MFVGWFVISLFMCRALANNSKCQDNAYDLACPKVVGHFRILVSHFILKSYTSWFPGYRSAKDIMSGQSQSFIHVPGKCPVSDCYLELCMCYINSLRFFLSTNMSS